MGARQVLLCDDEVHILRAAQFKLQRAGFEVRCASDGQEAWEMLVESLPDVLVTDCQMPRLDGLSLCRRMRDDPRTKELPIIVLSAKGFELSPEELAEQYGIAALVAKPFSPRQLCETIEAVIADTSGKTDETEPIAQEG